MMPVSIPGQGELFLAPTESLSPPAQVQTLDAAALCNYDFYYLGFSGGKDSLAALLYLLELGVPREKIELHHCLVDGREGPHMMDWPVTEDYCRAIARHLGIPIYMSWKEGGFRQELLRQDAATAATWFETPEGVHSSGGNSDSLGTRMRFPQLSASLQTRWCSAYLKIGVCAASITGQPRFRGRRTLVITGERAEESAGRARYAVFEPHRTDARQGRLTRHVDHFRPIHTWPEARVWDIIRRWRIRPHPAYVAGWGRLSCALCIFGSPNQWASAAVALPDQVKEVRGHEAAFKVTIHRKRDVAASIALGTPYAAANAEILAIARDIHYRLPVVMEPWQLPAGAFGEADGSP